MSTTALIGTLALYLNDGEGNQELASLLDVRLSFSVKMRRAFDPKVIPGTQAWSAEGTHLQLVDGGSRASYLALLEAASIAKTLLTVTFTSPAGAEYTGSGYIERFSVGAGEGDVLPGSFSIRGTSALTKIEGPMIFMVGSNESFYTMAGNFTQETDTELDLTSYSIIDITFNPVTNRVLGLGTTGKVYQWDIEGGNFEQLFDSGFSDFTQIMVDIPNQNIILSRHNTTGVEHSSYGYTLAGASVWNHSHRDGSTVADAANFASGGKGYIYIYGEGSGDPNVKNSRRLKISDGTIESLQSVSVFGSTFDVAFDEVGGRAFRGINQYLYLYSTEVVENPSAATVLGERNFSALSMDYFEYGGSGYVVGCGSGSKLGSFRIGASAGVADRTANNMRLVCTKKGYV